MEWRLVRGSRRNCGQGHASVPLGSPRILHESIVDQIQVSSSELALFRRIELVDGQFLYFSHIYSAYNLSVKYTSMLEFFATYLCLTANIPKEIWYWLYDSLSPLYPQKLALTSPTSGGRHVGIVRSRTKATKLVGRIVCQCRSVT
jgi:hypothetical protein